MRDAARERLRKGSINISSTEDHVQPPCFWAKVGPSKGPLSLYWLAASLWPVYRIEKFLKKPKGGKKRRSGGPKEEPSTADVIGPRYRAAFRVAPSARAAGRTPHMCCQS